jgi:methyl-accepting chemotaxis protein
MSFQDKNRHIKRKLILLPIFAILIVSLTMAAIGAVVAQIPQLNQHPFLTLMLSAFAVTALYSTILILSFKKNFITRLDRLQNGIFGFLDYLAGIRSEISYIDENTGDMSDAINEKIAIIEKNLEKDRAFMKAFIACAHAVEQGDFRKRIKEKPANPMLQQAHEQINEMFDALQKNIGSDLSEILHTIDNYTNEKYISTIQNPKGSIEAAIDHLGEVIATMLKSDLNTGLDLSKNTKDVNEKINQAYHNINTNLKGELSTIVDTVDAITEHIKGNVESASFITSYSESVTDAAKEGERLANQTADAMCEISEQVETINEAISIIDKITMQTNILSLNAAVEASTAGEAGKGFAVVAQEVRNLASQTAKASKEIREVVDIAKNKATIGNEISARMIAGYSHLVEQVSKTMELIYTITKNSNHQDTQIQNIHNLVNDMQQLIDSALNDLTTAKKLSDENHYKAYHMVESTKAKEFGTTTVA